MTERLPTRAATPAYARGFARSTVEPVYRDQPRQIRLFDAARLLGRTLTPPTARHNERGRRATLSAARTSARKIPTPGVSMS